jgi:hypothetical protein
MFAAKKTHLKLKDKQDITIKSCKFLNKIKKIKPPKIQMIANFFFWVFNRHQTRVFTLLIIKSIVFSFQVKNYYVVLFK